MKLNKALAGLVQAFQIKEAEASCALDGETQSCETCPLGKDYREKIKHEIGQKFIKDMEFYFPNTLLVDSKDCWEELKKKWRLE